MRVRGEHGSVLPLIVGFAAILVLAIGVAVDASAAYLRRQGLATLADDAALAAATAVPEALLYAGVPAERLAQETAAARVAATGYLARSGAYADYPGLQAVVTVSTDGTAVRVRLSAPLRLPLTVPGAPAAPTISAEGSAAGLVTG